MRQPAAVQVHPCTCRVAACRWQSCGSSSGALSCRPRLRGGGPFPFSPPPAGRVWPVFPEPRFVGPAPARPLPPWPPCRRSAPRWLAAAAGSSRRRLAFFEIGGAARASSMRRASLSPRRPSDLALQGLAFVFCAVPPLTAATYALAGLALAVVDPELLETGFLFAFQAGRRLGVGGAARPLHGLGLARRRSQSATWPASAPASASRAAQAVPHGRSSRRIRPAATSGIDVPFFRNSRSR